MRDPEMVLALYPWDEAFLAEPVYFRNDYVGTEQFVYVLDDDGRRTHVRANLKRELTSFARMWFRNLRAQGFFDADAAREVLS